MSKRIIIAITGASGAIYAKVLLDKLTEVGHNLEKVGIVMSDNAKKVWEFELGAATYADYKYDFYTKGDFSAPFASGSANYQTMIVVPCSMGTMARIAQGLFERPHHPGSGCYS